MNTLPDYVEHSPPTRMNTLPDWEGVSPPTSKEPSRKTKGGPEDLGGAAPAPEGRLDERSLFERDEARRKRWLEDVAWLRRALS
jgi:hypothetical protein